MKKPTIVTDDAATVKLLSRHDQVQKDIAQFSPERQAQVRALQAEVDAEIVTVNEMLNDQIDVEAKLRAASGLHHSDAEKVLRAMSQEPVGKIKEMYGTSWVHTPFKTVVRTQVYVDTLQNRVISLSSISAEAEIDKLTSQRAQLYEALKEFTNMSMFGLIKLSLKRFFKRGN